MRNLPGAVVVVAPPARHVASPPLWVLTGPQDARTRIGLLGALACAGRRGGFAVHPWLYLTRSPTTAR